MTSKPKTKKCSTCNRHKPLSAFYRDRATKDGRKYICSACLSKKVRVKVALKKREAFRKLTEWPIPPMLKGKSDPSCL